jgi:serine-type D-Ala-D-Ala carboxypeptidase/endopeptidase (penicillin-binding protein 4)
VARSLSRGWAPLAVIVVLLAVSTATYGLGWVDHWRGHDRVAAAPPPRPLGIALPSPTPAPPVAAVSTGGTLRKAKLATLLRQHLDSALGGHVLAAVAPTSGAPVVVHGRGSGVPASTNKLLTAATVLRLDGPAKRFTTTVVARGHAVTLVGGGDPLLVAEPEHTYPRRANLTTLAHQAAAALKQRGVTRIRLTYDDSLFTGPAVNPTWPAGYIAEGVVAPITALWVDEGRADDGESRVADPALVAAQAFAKALTVAGIRIRRTPVAAAAPAGAEEIAHVDSPPLREIVDHVLETSDNEGAEVLAHQAGLAAGTGASFDGGVQAVLRTLPKLGVDTTGIDIHDGSGLSREDSLPVTALVQVLQAAAGDDQLAPIVSALPVAGFSGSLIGRYDDRTDQGRGVVRAKTGTLTGVDALAGYTRDANGTPLVFAVIADRVAVPDTLKARDALDELATGLTTCRCG